MLAPRSRLPAFIAALPDFGLAGLFLATWVAPGAVGPHRIGTLLLVMLLEFFVVHSAGFMGAAAFGDGRRAQRLKWLLGLGLLYTLFVGAFAAAFGNLVAPGGLLGAGPQPPAGRPGRSGAVGGWQDADHAGLGRERGLRAAIAEHGLPVRDLSAADLRRDFPLFRLPAHFEAIFEREAGFVFAGRAVAAQTRLALAQGARLRPETPIGGWRAAPSGVALKTGDGEEIFDGLVIAAGAWAGPFLALEKAQVTAIEKTLFWRRPPTDEFALAAGFSPFAIETDTSAFSTAFPRSTPTASRSPSAAREG